MGGWFVTFQYMEWQHVLDNVGHLGMGIVMQHSGNCHEHARMHTLDGGTKVSEDSTIALCVGANVMVLECQHQQSIDVKGNSMTFPADGWTGIS
jgi:hypothetical protein